MSSAALGLALTSAAGLSRMIGSVLVWGWGGQGGMFGG